MVKSTVAYHIEKHKMTEVNGLQRHDERVAGQKHSNKRIDDSRTHKNIFLIKRDDTYKKRIEEELEKRYKSKRKPRSDSVALVSQTVQFGGLLAERSEREQVEVLRSCSDFLIDYFGSDNTISSVIHLDETNPHLHISFVPLTADGRLSAKEMTSRNNLFDIQKKILGHLQEKFPSYSFDKAEKNGRGFDNGKSQKDYEKLKDEKRRNDEAFSVANRKLQEEKAQVEAFRNKLLSAKKNIEKRESVVSDREKNLRSNVQILNEHVQEVNAKNRNTVLLLREKEKELSKKESSLDSEMADFRAEKEASQIEFEQFKTNLIEMLTKLFEEAKQSILARRKLIKLTKEYQPLKEERLEDFARDLEKNLLEIENNNKMKELTL